jgi:hypothetical protein
MTTLGRSTALLGLYPCWCSPDVVKLFMNPECLGQGVEVLVAIFRVGEATADRQWSSICEDPQFEVSVMRDCHESGKRWSPEDGVVL